MLRWHGKPSIRAHNSSQRSHGERSATLPPRGRDGASGTIPDIGPGAGSRSVASVGSGAGAGSQCLGRPSRSTERGGGSRIPDSASIARPSTVPGTFETRRGLAPGPNVCADVTIVDPRRVDGPTTVGEPPRASHATLAGESPGPPLSSDDSPERIAGPFVGPCP